jgi:hypothetical protein
VSDVARPDRAALDLPAEHGVRASGQPRWQSSFIWYLTEPYAGIALVLGYRRIIYTNTLSVMHVQELAAALGVEPAITGVLLIADDATIYGRLAARETGGGLQAHLERGRARARELDQHAPSWVHRVNTGSKSVASIAREIIALTGWTSPPP